MSYETTPCADKDQAVSNDNDTLAAGMTQEHLAVDVAEAKNFLCCLSSTCLITPGRGMVCTIAPDWAAKLVRRNGVAGAVIEKAGSRMFVKRRPEDPAAFETYVQKQFDAKAPLLFRVGFGPLKNVNLDCGCRQEPDWAEYLAIVQLARFMHAIAGVYPHGVTAEIVPDDIRSSQANRCPAHYMAQYITGLQSMVAKMGLAHAITVENGQERIYTKYNVPAFREQAAATMNAWKEKEPEAFAARWERALENASKNLPCTEDYTAEEIEQSAWNYLVAHRAEILSGLWSPGDAFPLRYANHPNSYQLYTIGFKKTKLPWQIELPVSLVAAA